ncbi:hypothetical protein DJ568_04490 [Mucilaginibacter hurinus]|uniref:MalT-like TPR region domain-containing protein n=1 Tax=Mucilaginibacter hurinus TaxID=2201324 RepID=A0A367GRD0_9SPHI|nr:hypothetical protein [Mucilaginibacter hurinus]RCH56012.1 hypothetical protein DJ568_04490 [Mucilaginibacter hurinus]
MKKLLSFLVVTLVTTSALADKLDSLRQQLKITSNDSLKAPIYASMAAEYMHYDTVTNRVKKLVYQNEAIINSYQSLRLYSKYNDTTGMRVSFDNLGKVYHAQQRYSQAKWFVLQSNNLSRLKNDVPNIIASLLKLAAIKTDIQEYKLAKQDLDEAKVLSENHKVAGTKAIVKKTYTSLQRKMAKKAGSDALSRKSKKMDSNGMARTNFQKKKSTVIKKTVPADTTKKLAAI